MHRTRRRTLLAMYGPVYRRLGLRDGSGGDAGDPNPQGGGAGSGGGQGDKTAQDGDPEKKPKLDGPYDPDRAMADLGKAREDAKREREIRLKAEQDQQAKLDAVLVALGLKPDPATDPAATAAKVAKELTDAQERISELTIENALYKLAGKAGGDVDALQDSRGFMAKLAELDPAADDFEKSVTAAVRDAVKANPKLAATTPGGQGPARQGADHGGGTGGRQRPTSLGAALTAAINH